VFARGLIDVEAVVLEELFRTLLLPAPAVLLALSLRLRGLEEGVVVM
jgi:hypothetical protein